MQNLLWTGSLAAIYVHTRTKLLGFFISDDKRASGFWALGNYYITMHAKIQVLLFSTIKVIVNLD